MTEPNKIEVDELYAFITKHMTPEQALKTILKGRMVEYDILRYSKDNEIHPLMLIVMAANEMGWNIALKNYDDNNDEDVQGIIVGTEEYVNSMLGLDLPELNLTDDDCIQKPCCGGGKCNGCE